MCKLTFNDALSLNTVLDAPTGNRKVARVFPDGNVVYGEARSVGTDTGMFDFDSDVRDQYLRVTSDMGFEHFWKVSDLMPEVGTGYFVVGYEG